MSPEEEGARRRHPAGSRRSPALRAVHSDTHTWGQQPRRGSATGVDQLLAAVFVLTLAAGVLAAVWLADWRWLATVVVVDVVVAFLAGRRRGSSGA